METIKKSTGFLLLLFFTLSCSKGISPSASGYDIKYCMEEDACDFSTYSKEELRKELQIVCELYAMWYAEWKHQEREAERIWVHDQMSFRLHKRRAASAAAEVYNYEIRLKILEKEIEKQQEGVQ